MATTLVGLYTTATAAEEALQDLQAHGFARGELYAAPRATDGQRDPTRNGLMRRLVAQGIPAREAELYADGVRRGGTLVVVQTPDKAAHRGLDMLNQRQPVRLPADTTHWPRQEWEQAAAPQTAPPRPAPAGGKRGFLGGLGVTELARRVFREVQQDNCLGQAAQLAYYLIFAVFPFMLFLATLIGYLPIPNLMDNIMEYLSRLLPGEAATLLRDNVRQLVTDQKGGLLSLGILLALWSASSAMVAVMEAMNQAYDVEEGRPFWKVRGGAILLTVGLSLFIILSMVLLIFGPQLGRWLASLVNLGSAFEVAWNLLRWPVIVGFLTVAMAIIYYFAPDVEQRWKWITPGAVFAVLTTIVLSLGFAFYVNNFGSYNKTYGSIGAVIVFLTWLYLTGLVIVVGGEINAEIEHASPEGKAPGAKTGA